MEFARLITSTMLGIPEDQIEGLDEIKDVLGEIANIVSGNLKSDFLDADLSCVVSTPSITRGSDFKIEPSRIGPVQQYIFRHKQHEIMIEIALKEELGAKVEIKGADKLSAEDLLRKINQVDVPTSVINAVIDVFYTMLSMEIETIPEVPEHFREEKRTVGSVTFAGDVHGVFIIQVNDSYARTMTAAMLGMEEDEIESEEEVFDVIREMSNIIGGNLKSGFVDVGLSCVLSTPSITNGRDFRVEALNIIKTQRFLFNCQGNTIIVDAGIKKDELQAAAEAADGTEPQEDGVEEKAADDELRNLNLILGIPLELTVELGRSHRRMNDLLKLGKGSLIELQQLEGEPVDLLVNETLIAKGEVMVEKEKYGIRIIEVVSRGKRLASLK
jgi:flagellar motor switch protein FliN/FliY